MIAFSNPKATINWSPYNSYKMSSLFGKYYAQHLNENQTGKVDIGNSKKGGTLEAKGGDSSGRYVDFQILFEMFGDVIGSCGWAQGTNLRR